MRSVCIIHRLDSIRMHSTNIMLLQYCRRVQCSIPQPIVVVVVVVFLFQHYVT